MTYAHIPNQHQSTRCRLSAHFHPISYATHPVGSQILMSQTCGSCHRGSRNLLPVMDAPSWSTGLPQQVRTRARYAGLDSPISRVVPANRKRLDVHSLPATTNLLPLPVPSLPFSSAMGALEIEPPPVVLTLGRRTERGGPAICVRWSVYIQSSTW